MFIVKRLPRLIDICPNNIDASDLYHTLHHLHVGIFDEATGTSYDIDRGLFGGDYYDPSTTYWSIAEIGTMCTYEYILAADDGETQSIFDTNMLYPIYIKVHYDKQTLRSRFKAPGVDTYVPIHGLRNYARSDSARTGLSPKFPRQYTLGTNYMTSKTYFLMTSILNFLADLCPDDSFSDAFLQKPVRAIDEKYSSLFSIADGVLYASIKEYFQWFDLEYVDCTEQYIALPETIDRLGTQIATFQQDYLNRTKSSALVVDIERTIKEETTMSLIHENIQYVYPETLLFKQCIREGCVRDCDLFAAFTHAHVMYEDSNVIQWIEDDLRTVLRSCDVILGWREMIDSSRTSDIEDLFPSAPSLVARNYGLLQSLPIIKSYYAKCLMHDNGNIEIVQRRDCNDEYEFKYATDYRHEDLVSCILPTLVHWINGTIEIEMYFVDQTTIITWRSGQTKFGTCYHLPTLGTISPSIRADSDLEIN